MVGEDFSKALSSILGASPRKVTALSRKALAPILVTPSEIVMLVRLLQLADLRA